jgi:hypothetical protein
MSRVTKIKLSQVPEVYHNQMFANLVGLRGVEGSRQAIVEDITLSAAFPWMLTPEGYDFWQAISEGGSPKVTITTKTVSSELEEVVKEAEVRGFANGVNTKWGLIRDEYKPGHGIQPHELLPDGTFFYRNIKVRKANGKWIKPLNTVSKIAKTEDDEVAIHAFIEKLIKAIHSN